MTTDDNFTFYEKPELEETILQAENGDFVAQPDAKMKVLAISSSPQLHGNSNILCDQFLKGATEAPLSTRRTGKRNHLRDRCME